MDRFGYDKNVYNTKSIVDLVKEHRAGKKDLMNALLSLTRMQNNKEQAVYAPCDIESLFIALIEELSPLAEEKDIDFGVDGPMAFTAFSSLPDLKCVLNNFTVNAIKYTPEAAEWI